MFDSIKRVIRGYDTIDDFTEQVDAYDAADTASVRARRVNRPYTQMLSYPDPPINTNQLTLTVAVPATDGLRAAIDQPYRHSEHIGEAFYTERGSGDYASEEQEKLAENAAIDLAATTAAWEDTLEDAGFTVETDIAGILDA